MAHVTLKQLRYFDALARTLHFGRAADECAVTQPALSMQIQELEQGLGVALLERTRTGVRLTELGRDFAERSRRILTDIRDLTEFVACSGAPLSGPLKLGVIPSIAPYILPPLLPDLQSAHPELKLTIRETQTATLVAELQEGKLDVLLLALPLNAADIEEHPLFEDRFVLALKAGHAISPKVRATPEIVEQEHLLLLEEGHCLRDQALEYCHLKKVDAIDTFGASSLATIVELVQAGFGVTLLPEMSVGVEARGRSLRLVRFRDPEPSRTVGLAWRATSPRRDDFLALARHVATAGTKALAAARSGAFSDLVAETTGAQQPARGGKAATASAPADAPAMEAMAGRRKSVPRGAKVAVATSKAS